MVTRPLNEPFNEESFDRAVHDLREAGGEKPLPPALIQRVQQTLRSLEASAHTHSTTKETNTKSTNVNLEIPKPNRSVPWRSFAIAASILAIAVGTWSWMGRETVAFATIQQRMESTSNVSMRLTTQWGDQSPQVSQLTLAGNAMRLEAFNGNLIQIVDLEQQTAMVLDTERKLAQSTPLNDALIESMGNPVDQLRSMRSENAKRVGAERIDDRECFVYQLAGVRILGIQSNADTLLWVDSETRLPAKLQIVDPDPRHEARIVFDQFAWDQPLDSNQFLVTMPKGYTEGELVLSPPTTKPESFPSPIPPQAAARVVQQGRVPRGIAWSHDGLTITALLTDDEKTTIGGKPNELAQWNVGSASQVWRMSSPGINALVASGNGELFATSVGREVQMRYLNDGSIASRWSVAKALPALAIDDSGTFAVTGIADWEAERQKQKPAGGAELWKLGSEQALCRVACDAPITRVAISRDGLRFATMSNDLTTQIWDHEGKLVHTMSHTNLVDFRPDGKALAAVVYSPEDQSYRLIQYANDTFEVLHESSLPGDHRVTWLSLAYSVDGKRLACGAWEGWLALVSDDDQWKSTHGSKVEGGIHVVAFSPDGTRLASGNEADGGDMSALRVWSVEQLLQTP